MRTPVLIAVLGVVTCLGVPAHADDAELYGLTCGLSTNSEPTGALFNDPLTQFGIVHGGPVLAQDYVDDPSPGPSHFVAAAPTVKCVIQVNYPTPYGGSSSWPSCSGSGQFLALAACVAQYPASASDDVYVCTEITATHAGSTQTVFYDADPTAPGIQCAHAQLTTGPGTWGFVVTPSPL